MKRRSRSLFALSTSAFQLGLEAQQVIGLRMMKAAMGGADAQTEATRMISEKTEAALQVHTLAMTGLMTGAAHLTLARTLALYRRKVQANRRRLLKG
jgi:hypothetical protein